MRWIARLLLMSAGMLGLHLTAFGQATKPPIKIGLLLPYTGVIAVNGQETSKGVEFYLSKIGSKAGDMLRGFVRMGAGNDPGDMVEMPAMAAQRVPAGRGMAAGAAGPARIRRRVGRHFKPVMGGGLVGRLLALEPRQRAVIRPMHEVRPGFLPQPRLQRRRAQHAMAVAVIGV